MSHRIRGDHERFKQIVNRKLRDNLHRHIESDHLMGKQGDKTVKIPLPRINIPRFRFGSQSAGGVGQGDGEEGDPLPGQEQQGEGQGSEAGDQAGDIKTIEMPMMEFIDIIIEELALPNLQPEGSDIQEVHRKYNSKAPQGPRGLRIFKDSYKRALRRNMSMGNFDAKKGMDFRKEDFRYRYAKEIFNPQADAEVYYLMDASASMGEDEKYVVKKEIFLLSNVLERLYQRQLGNKSRGIRERFYLHDSRVEEVSDRETFLTKDLENGGTLIRPALEQIVSDMKESRERGVKNFYLFQYSDGDIFPEEKRTVAPYILEHQKDMNLYAYTQVPSFFGGAGPLYHILKNDMEHHIKNKEVVLHRYADDFFENQGKYILESIQKKLSLGK